MKVFYNTRNKKLRTRLLAVLLGAIGRYERSKARISPQNDQTGGGWGDDRQSQGCEA